MCFDRVHPLQFFLDNPLIPHPHNLCVPSTPQTSLCCPNIPGCVLSSWSVVTLLGATLSENTASPSPVPPAANNHYSLHSPSMLGFRLACACRGSGHAVTTPVSSFVHCPAVSRCSFLVVTFSALVLSLLTLVE